MKIIKGMDGTLWVFRESKGGWIRPDENNGDFDPGDLINELIKIKMNEKKDFSFSMALTEVAKENRELAKQYLEHMKGIRSRK